VAVTLTAVPEQIVVAVDVKLTEGVSKLFTVTEVVEEVAVLGAIQFALEVIITYTVALPVSVVVKVPVIVEVTWVPLRYHA
jgi:hypothetical protein